MREPLVDIGANLADGSFRHDLDAVLERSWDAGLQWIVVTGSDWQSNERAFALARQHQQRLYATAGLHPHHAENWGSSIAAQIEELSRQPEVVAIGECGLDYFRDLSPRPIQRTAFSAQLELAVSADLPVFLHQRDAHPDFVAILREYRPHLKECVVHCFTGNEDALVDYLSLGCYIGITGWICDERRGLSLQKLVREIPHNRLLIESDAPYLLPRSMRPRPKDRRNEPAFLPWVAQSIAEVCEKNYPELAVQTTCNAASFFRRNNDPSSSLRGQVCKGCGQRNNKDD